MADKANQARRMVFMLKKFQNGLKYTTTEMHELLEEEFGPISLKTVQRDLNILQECESTLENVREDGQIYWRIPRGFRPARPINISTNEALSLYILKAHLRAFRGTAIETHIEDLYQKLQEYAPGEPYSRESLFWDQNYGHYDYSDYDDTINQVIDFINNRKWAHVKYRKAVSKRYNNFICLFEKMFTYGGSLYVAIYVPFHGNHIAIKIERIMMIEEADWHDYKPVEFNFSKFRKERFGVFHGENKDVWLKIRKGYEEYFINRKWHPTQKIEKNKDGEMLLKMRVPIVPDFIGWVISWSEVLTVVKPVALIKELNMIYRNGINNYSE